MTGGSGIFRSGRSEYYGTQPNDNEHSFAVVLLEMEMQKKIEQDEEMKKKRREGGGRGEDSANFTTFMRALVPSWPWTWSSQRGIPPHGRCFKAPILRPQVVV